MTDGNENILKMTRWEIVGKRDQYSRERYEISTITNNRRDQYGTRVYVIYIHIFFFFFIGDPSNPE